ncbi:TetR/AcrR family transcriptional regulator [Streptococcus gordonii]|jgi:transcriptional regulator (tetR/acrR family)|uniref:TetR/AcrR family transcriptional regulator n=1 Tax=Streptococcus gordonii TaxID=1302 RepID=UPI001CBD2B9D|nr:TetR/AcrR family transcriptional regulator [Streptococcus gordonii]MBZ2124644.1 TetR/AcrR family transcriptional regulator [Streptococcus gordonii]WAM20624.1 TetR/AcrR family transcriptional regulator [Streptococcus gordonii]
MTKDTRARIIEVAEALFQKKSYQDVGVREIARAAGCSHTAIYQYFKTKDSILYAVAEEPLERLYVTCLAVCQEQLSKKEKLLQLCQVYIDFGFQERNFYDLLILYHGQRVDQAACVQPIHQLRMKSFYLLQESVSDLLPADMKAEEKLNISRAVFIFLHGLVTIYSLDYQECPAWVRQMMLDYMDYTILKKKI